MDKKLISEMLDSLDKLVSIPSTEGSAQAGAPFGAECRRALDYALSLGAKMGFEVFDADGYAGHIDFGDGEETLGILCHLDVVPAGDGWTHPPFRATVKDGRIFGRGTVDNKGSFIACLYAMRELKKEGFIPSRKIRLIAGCNEETGCRCMEYYKKKLPAPDLSFVPDADFPVINSEKGIIHLLLTVPKDDFAKKYISGFEGGSRANIVPSSAVLTLTEEFNDAAFFAAAKKTEGVKIEKINGQTVLTAQGKSCHAMCPEKGENAISKLMSLYKALECPTTNESTFMALCSAFSPACLADSLNVACADSVSGEMTVSLGIISADEDNFYLTIDCRIPLCGDTDTLMSAIKSVAPDTTLEILQYKKNLYVSADSELVKSLLEVYRKHCGGEPKALFTGGGTYAKEFDNAVAFGPTFHGQQTHIHDIDETLTQEEFSKMYAIYYDAIKTLSK